MSDNIKVVVKVRPLIRREIEDKQSLQWRVNNNALVQIDQNGKECGPVFTFDKVYDEETKTEDVYKDIAKPIVEAATAGFNGTIFAYGQTSSGKTYTMTGTDESPGIIPLAVLNLFDIIKNVPDRDFLVRVSYIEIYNETLIDLLNIEKQIKVHETFQGVKVNATEKVATSPEEVLEVMKEGKANRQTGSTNMNEESSRSHSIFQITIESREHIEGEEEVGSVNVSQLNLVDLAGSERAGQTGATGLRFKEGTHINKSLSVLALVIKQLSEDPNKHANYRDSKLTRILQNSLGGNAKTSIICAVTPAALEETISTLQFANRAKSIKNTPAVNAVATNASMIQSLTKQLSALKTQLESKKHVEQDNFKLQKQITSLQRLILNGFGQSSTDMLGGARRKLQNRRVTISTLHPIQEDTVSVAPTVPRFCTPSLKYNPLSLNTLPEFVPIQSAASLPSVSEEPRLITPPPVVRKVTICDDIIEIDSDEDSSLEVQTCSPYHGCYESSKTPPCILRKNAKQAEKNLKDIVELTEREKIYTPNVVELMEQVENKSLKIADLEEKINKLDGISREKDKEMEILKSKINDAEQKIKDIKLNLETACKTYATKITDWEVSYETLQKKAKSREEELLSLLKEHESKKKNEKIGKISSMAIGKDLAMFMDLSRDVSLVSSDNENSIINIEATNPGLSTNKLLPKDETIMQLEANLHAQNLKVKSLEDMNKKFQDMISDSKQKISLLENENTSQKLTIENLSRTIESQKLDNEIAKAEIESYKNIIEELNVKLSSKADISKDVNVSDIEKVIANEESFFANNDNIKNIILTLKTALDMRNDEINKLKSSLDNESSENIKTLQEELENKKREICLLVKEMESLKEDHISDVNNFLLEKNNLLSIEQQLKTQLLEIQALKDKEAEEYFNKIEDLTTCKENLNSELTKMQQDNESLHSKVRNLTQEVIILKNENTAKDNIIFEIRKKENALRVDLSRVTLQLQNIIKLLSGKISEVPKMIDDLVAAFGTLTDNLTSLETIAKDIVKEKNDLLALAESNQKTFNNIKSVIDDLDNSVDAFYKDGEPLNNTNTFENLQEDSHLGIESKIKNLMNKIKTTLEYLQNSVQNKDMEVKSIKVEYESKLTSESAKHLQGIQEMTENRRLLLVNLLQKANSVAKQCDIECDVTSCVSGQIESDPENNSEYEQIIFIFDKIADQFLLLKSEKATENDSIQEILSVARKEIYELTEENKKLLRDISNLEKSNLDLSAEIKYIKNDGKKLASDLKESNTVLNELQCELLSKTSEIEIIENKAKEWKDKFRENEMMMKEQIKMLELENLELKTKFSKLKIQSKQTTRQTNLSDGIQECPLTQSFDSPPSLTTICCNRILEYIRPNENDNLESSSSITSTDLKYICQCTDLKADIDLLQKENNNLKIRIEQLKITNDCLIKEQEEIQKEVQLLVESTHDLQKKVVNHRTNLSTLTATTFAENKSLNSQIKFLQHHHNRFHNVCQKDIPALKNQLQDLMVILKSENTQGLYENLKPYSLPNTLDITQCSTHSKFKNESILDGDLLMLDTNVTLTTCDNTLVGHDQSCLDVTQVCACNEVACQTSLNEITINDLLHSQMEIGPLDYIKVLDTLESLKAENNKLRILVDEYSKSKNSSIHLADAMSSPIKFQKTVDENNCECVKILDSLESMKAENMKLRDLVDEYSKNKVSNIESKDTISNPIEMQNTFNEKDLSCHCNHADNAQIMIESHKKEIGLLNKKLHDLESQKQDIEQKYRDLTLEVPSTELLVQKLNVLEKERCSKQTEIAKITDALKSKNEQIKLLQEENDTLSTQVMESITELDDLKKEHDSLKEINTKLTENCTLLRTEIEDLKHQDEKEIACTECKLKSELIINLETKLANNSHIKLDQSYSDHDNSSRCNKICSLQNEFHAGKEDCIELKEEVTTIKNHLERSSHAMDLDVNIESSHLYSYTDFENINTQSIKCDLPNISRKSSLFDLEKEKCLNYYAEITGADKFSLSSDINLIDIMKTLYNYIQVKHANEVENLVNKLKDYEESKNALQNSLEDLKTERIKTTKELEEKNSYLHTMANVVSNIRNNIAVLSDSNYIQDIVFNFKDSFLKVIDKEFGLSSTAVFELVIQQLLSQNTIELERLKDDKTKLEHQIQHTFKNLELAEERCKTLESQLIEKEKEFNLLQQQKEKVHEINASVTLDIVKKEQDLRQLVINGFRQLVEKKFVNEEVDFSLSTNKLIELLFDLTMNLPNYNELMQKEKDHAIAEINSLKSLLDIKNSELHAMISKLTEAQEKCKNIQLDLIKKEEELKTQISQFESLNTVHSKTVEENDECRSLIKQLTEEIEGLRATLQSKVDLVTSLETKLEAYNDKIGVENETIAKLQKETEMLKAMNEVILKEKENYSLELEKACSTIKQNKIDLDKMTNDILMLKQTAKESSTVTNNLRNEIDNLSALNKRLQEQVQEKCQNCSRLEMNIKTHEKAAQVQSRMIIRLQKQKEEDDKLSCEKDVKLDEMIEKCKTLEEECEKLTNDLKSSRDEVEIMKNGKLLLEARISDLEEEVQSSKRRTSLEATAETTRRRRQSIHDSRRMFAEDNEDHAALITRPVTEDSLMEVDGGESSSRSTPVLMHRGRDSLLSKHDQSDREEEQPRSSSVQASRRRRQSVHDMHRSVRHTPEPRENSRESSRNNSVDSEVSQLRKQLASCHKEVEELKERCRELDEECETCAEYLRERDEQCIKLKREKRELEKNLSELKDKLNTIDSNGGHTNKRSFSDAAVNTDEDWANLHSVVVDRMSFDAEVEKNKRLVKTIEELRFRKQELKVTMAKMQKALDRCSGRDKELEATRASLAASEREVSELRARCRELHDECEACAARLRERDDQCRRLRDAKAALEAKLQECGEAEAAVQSLRKKRQALHDQRRAPPAASADAATDTSDDLLSYQVERDNNKLAAEEKQSLELKRLRMALEKLSQQKSDLEQQLSAAPHYVATGSAIVQNQQITDVLKENQKLKKMNAKLVSICKKRGKALTDSNRENEQPLEQFNI